MKKAAGSKDYCDELVGTAQNNGIQISELSTDLQGQRVAAYPAYDQAFDALPRRKCATIPRPAKNG